ncbi:MAG: mononuclear molybdenum enzyme YedY [Anaerolineae bacterium UTCFX2]|jgi:sulfoxide reductase catalytic subunit YedY|nr:protein-methionine-sulfoxide reductase catalytic subunit MsrP [Anaerolineales bacterium]OQY93533.1 MAG: mononuclear molybdenum enzyme YedY [Anaerolineae bacterium UTCFX2]
MAEKFDCRTTGVHPSEITPEHVYLNRRGFLKSLGIAGAGAFLAACGGSPPASPTGAALPAVTETAVQGEINPTDEPGDALTSFEQITNFNNFYEFTFSKRDVAKLAQEFPTSPWQVEVYGLVNNPHTFRIEDLLKQFTQEQRIYRMRCVEAWSMVIPWQGFPLAQLLEVVEPKPSAKFVRFETVFDPERMPGLKNHSYPWPYQEGLRLDEALHDLTILATGLYGKPMPAQNGSPIRLVVPWKYGFKSIKSIAKIELVETQPATLWTTIAPHEYGFYANVNPKVDHPRWSQASERRIGESKQRPTLLFNGYADQVAHLYEGMDLQVDY